MLTLEELIERTARMQASGSVPSSPAPAPKPTSPTLPKCPHEGDVITTCPGCHTEDRHVRWCRHEAHHSCVRNAPDKVTEDITNCATCDHHPVNAARNAARSLPVLVAPPRPAFAPRPGDPACGVVIGSYGWPELIALQLRVIRDTCGPVPVLVSNDKPEAHAALLAICAAGGDVTLDTNPERIGHVGGDMGAFHKGAVWGAARGLTVVAKLSQRFLVTRPRWLQDGATDLIASGLPLATRRCKGRENYDLRTEACLLDVARWNKPAVLARVAPRRYWGDAPGTGVPAEAVVYRTLLSELGGVYWPWALYGEDRYTAAEGTVWHCSHGRAAYDALAARHGVTLPADFHTDGWQRDLKRGTYAHG